MPARTITGPPPIRAAATQPLAAARYRDRVAAESPASDGPAHEPVLISLSTPARRSLVADLVRPPGPNLTRPVLDAGSASAPPVLDADGEDAEVADFLAAIAHEDTGYIARTADGARALAIVAATTAALCGEDIRAALRQPDIAFLTSLKPAAVEAVRAVLLAIETDHPERVREELAVLGS